MIHAIGNLHKVLMIVDVAIAVVVRAPAFRYSRVRTPASANKQTPHGALWQAQM